METKYPMLAALAAEMAQAQEDEALLRDIFLAMGPYSEGITPEDGKKHRINDRLRKRFDFDDSE